MDSRGRLSIQQEYSYPHGAATAAFRHNMLGFREKVDYIKQLFGRALE